MNTCQGILANFAMSFIKPPQPGPGVDFLDSAQNDCPAMHYLIDTEIFDLGLIA